MSPLKTENVPPAIRILLDEDLPVSPKPSETKRFFRRLLPELQQQAEWTLGSFKYDGSESLPTQTKFVITASGPLDPFSDHGICARPECRIGAAKHFARKPALS